MLSQKPLNNKPAGAEDYDAGALTEGQQIKLNQKKVCKIKELLSIVKN